MSVFLAGLDLKQADSVLCRERSDSNDLLLGSEGPRPAQFCLCRTHVPLTHTVSSLEVARFPSWIPPPRWPALPHRCHCLLVLPHHPRPPLPTSEHLHVYNDALSRIHAQVIEPRRSSLCHRSAIWQRRHKKGEMEAFYRCSPRTMPRVVT